MNQHQNYPSLKFHGNLNTMNLNPLLISNIQSSLYFKKHLIHIKDYYKAVDEIYYHVKHLEPWEKGSDIMNKTFKVYRGVGGCGIVSTAFCLLYKLHKMKLTHKQVVKLIHHEDSPYIRALGFLYIRYTQPPDRLWGWFKNFIFDDEILHVKSGNRMPMSIGKIVQNLLFEKDWLNALLPRIPVSTMNTIQHCFSDKEKKRHLKYRKQKGEDVSFKEAPEPSTFITYKNNPE
ncbi:pre-mRNA-splicing factor 38B-like [Stegodyphus dumicola]|uniref:pre-mRNA-splicing factor 38B-like n=1 Tax=Stegodyphus dumicola TaxID=202533 RepID=UPI0015ACE56F|nr:pre-mRNA-splicing factor 38B-like [Stegodyphus dumicola]